jgi:hypothetical protein
LNIRTRAKQNPPVASVNAALERDLITLQCEPVASTEFAFNIGPYQVPTAPKLLLCLPSIVIYPRLWLTLTVENGGVLVQCTPTFIGSSKNYKSRQLKSSLQLLTGGDLEQYPALAERAVAALVPRWAPDRGPL